MSRSEHSNPRLLARPRSPLGRAPFPALLAHHRRAVRCSGKLHGRPAGRTRLALRPARGRPRSRARADAHAGNPPRQAPQAPRRCRPRGPQALQHTWREVGKRPLLLARVSALAVVSNASLDARFGRPLFLQPLQPNADPAPRARARRRCRRAGLGSLTRGRCWVWRRHPHAAAPPSRHRRLAFAPHDGLCRSAPGRAVAFGRGGLAGLLRGGLRPGALHHVPRCLSTSPGRNDSLVVGSSPARSGAGGAWSGGGVTGRGRGSSSACARVAPAW